MLTTPAVTNNDKNDPPKATPDDDKALPGNQPSHETDHRDLLICEDNSPMHEAIQQATRCARLIHSPVLIQGETGTGKEGIARLLHRESRLTGPWRAFNCGALDAGLATSELFGHEKGSFTSAHKQHIGLFEQACGGTLFLDEITEMPLEMQAKLLRVLDDKEITRVGGTETIPVKVRIVMATNRNLEEAVAEGKLRKDLSYRLKAGSIIDLPPLRDRKMDIPKLARHFAEMAVAPYKKDGFIVPEISPPALEALEKHDWDGNVRELMGVIKRAACDAQNVPLGFKIIIASDSPEIKKLSSQKTGEHVRRYRAERNKSGEARDWRVIKQEIRDLTKGLNTSQFSQLSGVERSTVGRTLDPKHCSFINGAVIVGLITHFKNNGNFEHLDKLTDLLEELMHSMNKLPKRKSAALE